MNLNVTPYIVGSVIPNIPVIPAERATLFVSCFLDFMNTPKAAPIWATTAIVWNAWNVSCPYISKLANTIGVTPQWTPKITTTCHNPPITAAATTGAKLYKALYPFAIAVATPSDTGPITNIVSGTIINIHINGVNNDLTTSGMILSTNFSK